MKINLSRFVICIFFSLITFLVKTVSQGVYDAINLKRHFYDQVKLNLISTFENPGWTLLELLILFIVCWFILRRFSANIKKA